MARFYATFDNTEVSALEAESGSNFYNRVAISSGSTLRTALLTTRQALSDAAYAVIDAGNRNGTLGIVVPPDVVTRAGGKYSWSNLYTNPGAVWPSDPRVRPTAQILSTDLASDAVSPTDAGELDPDTPYTNAQTALENCFTAMTGGGPRGRIGLNPWRTLASVWHDHALTYLAWDDFTPGTPQSLTVSGFGTTTNYTASLLWNFQFRNDKNTAGAAIVQARLTRTDGGSEVYIETRNLTGVNYPTAGSVDVTFAETIVAGTYDLDVVLSFTDAVISAHEGAPATAFDNGLNIGSI
jgi:hypothetical protein